MNEAIDLNDFWVTNDGDVISYELLDEAHARNILRFLKSKRLYVPQKLLDRIEFFQQKRNGIRKLF